MATSGTVVFRLNRDQLITQALIKVGAVDPENSSGPNANQIANAASDLNLFVKALQTKGLQLWERKYVAVFPQKSQGIYILGTPGPGGDHATFANNLNEGSFLQTTLATTATGTTAVLTTLANIGTVGIPDYTLANTHNIGIELDTGFIQWFTVNGAPSGNTVTLSGSLSSQASLGNTVYGYQTKAVRPLRMLNGFYRQSTGNDIPVRVISRDEYDRFGLKTSTGTLIQAFYNPDLNSGTLEVYPQPADVDGIFYMEMQKPIDDFNNSTDDYDLPQEWGEALVWGLARRQIPNYRVPKDTANDIRSMAAESLKLVSDWDQEAASIYFQPEGWMYDYGRR